MGRVVERKTAYVASARTSRTTLIVGGIITILLGALTGLGISMYADRKDREEPAQRVVAVASDAAVADGVVAVSDGAAPATAVDAQLIVADAQPGVADAQVVTVDAPRAGATDPAKLDLPGECREYRAALEKLVDCRQLPQTSRDGIKTAVGKLDARWAALGPLTDAAKRELAEKCTQDMGSIKKSRALCSGRGGGGGGSSPW